MDKPKRRLWLRMVLLIGLTYCAIGIGFGAFAAWSTSNQMVVAWRVASFVISLVAFALHIGYELFKLANRPVIVALHTALAVALGAFALAVAANIHAIGVASANHGLLAIALAIWPLMTGIPAFVVALITANVLRLVRPMTEAQNTPR